MSRLAMGARGQRPWIGLRLAGYAVAVQDPPQTAAGTPVQWAGPEEPHRQSPADSDKIAPQS
ncbi:hypothetical protein GCM10010199_35200 [Dactylosporangium roseum]